MKKVNCYSKIASLIYLIIFFISLIVGVIPFALFKEQEGKMVKAIWIIIFVFCILFCIFGFFYHRQYLYVKDNKLILKNLFCTIKVLDIADCYYEVTRLQSYYGRSYILDDWICIYSIYETQKFKYGFSNGKRFKRIQLTYNESNLAFIASYIKKKEFIIKSNA